MSKVLIIEDDPTMTSLLRTLLEFEGFQPLIAAPDEDVLQTIRRQQPDVVLMDIHLRGGLNGLDVTRQIRAAEDLKDTRVILVSGMPLESECLAAGANDFVLKPYMPDDLIRRIQQVLGA